MAKLKIGQKQSEDVVELWLEKDNKGDVLVKSRKNGGIEFTEAIFYNDYDVAKPGKRLCYLGNFEAE